MDVLLKRAYDEPAGTDGFRILVDRLWPRGKKKADLRLDAWAKDLAPSSELRKWFRHDAHRWPEFCRRYKEELKKSIGAKDHDGHPSGRTGTVPNHSGLRSEGYGAQ